jgi:hypothetical protein
MLNLCVPVAVICVGGLLLMFDYESNALKALAVMTAGICFCAGLWIGKKLDKSKALPE